MSRAIVLGGGRTPSFGGAGLDFKMGILWWTSRRSMEKHFCSCGRRQQQQKLWQKFHKGVLKHTGSKKIDILINGANGGGEFCQGLLKTVASAVLLFYFR